MSGCLSAGHFVTQARKAIACLQSPQSRAWRVVVPRRWANGTASGGATRGGPRSSFQISAAALGSGHCSVVMSERGMDIPCCDDMRALMPPCRPWIVQTTVDCVGFSSSSATRCPNGSVTVPPARASRIYPSALLLNSDRRHRPQVRWEQPDRRAVPSSSHRPQSVEEPVIIVEFDAGGSSLAVTSMVSRPDMSSATNIMA